MRRLKNEINAGELSTKKGEDCTPSVMSGNRTRVVLSAPLHGGSLEGMVTGPSKLQERYKWSSITGVTQGNVPPHGFSEDHTGPAASHFATLE